MAAVIRVAAASGRRPPRRRLPRRRHRGWYCPPTYYAGSSWLWGGPWDWWWGWGTGWGWGGWGWGWGGGGVYVINEGAPVANQYARIDTDVSPEAAEVYLDGTLIGQADDFDGFPDYLYLETGKYRLEFRHPSYETIVKEIDVRAGQAIALNDEMKLLPGIKKLQVVDPEDKGTPLGRVFGKPGTQKSEAEGDQTGRYDVQGGPDAGIDGVPVEIDFDGPDEDVRLARAAGAARGRRGVARPGADRGRRRSVLAGTPPLRGRAGRRGGLRRRPLRRHRRGARRAEPRAPREARESTS